MDKKYKLLYIEDEEDIRKDYLEYFSIYADTIYEASDGIDGWEKYIKYKPDIIIADISMPRLNGLELVEKIREGDKKTQIIMLTAHSEQDKLFSAIKLNLVDYLLKPISRKSIKLVFEKAFKNLEDASGDIIFFDDKISWNKETSSLYTESDMIVLSKQERLLLELLIKKKNQAVDGITIFNTIWDDFDQEFDAGYIRTLIKKLRKKLPKDSISNVYGGEYILKI